MAKLDFGAGHVRFVDCAAGAIVDERSAIGRVVTHPDDLCRVIEGKLDPRNGMLFRNLKVGGDVPTLTRFCDRLAGNRSQTYRDGYPAFPNITASLEQGRPRPRPG